MAKHQRYFGICTCNNEHIGNGCEIRFIECKHKCSTKHGMCDNDIGNCKCDTQTKGLTCEESRLLIESSDSTNSKGGTINIIGYFGNTTSLLTIKIGESQCKNIKVFNETTLKCDIGEGKGIHNITIIDDDLSFTAINKFQYLDEKTKISKISRGAIAGIVVGCVVAVSLIVHFDGSYERTEGPKTSERSHITCQLYLNDVEKGCETTFFVGPNQEEIKVNPSTVPNPTGYQSEFIEFNFNGNFQLNDGIDRSSGVQQLSFLKRV
ncbi:hypothetical protein ACTFIR_001229 [Dictyostelium discoideum]